jgi:NAD(P)-dependent dehydrogenase (short-subunit alcohol dehydrogenase family)
LPDLLAAEAGRIVNVASIAGLRGFAYASPYIVAKHGAVGLTRALAAGRADLVALARPQLIDPSWTLRAAAQQDYRRVAVPKPYLGGMAQLARNLQREAELKA